MKALGLYTHTHTGSLKENKKKNIKGITLVALVVTIIILLILAGISISALTQTGLFGKVKEAKQKSENAQKEENAILENFENSIDTIITGQRENTSIFLHSPILLVSSELPSITRNAGLYKASSSEYTQTNSEKFNSYLSLESNGWKVLKSGLYQLYTFSTTVHNGTDDWITDKLVVNDNEKILLYGYTPYHPSGANYITQYFDKGDIVDFYHNMNASRKMVFCIIRNICII